MKKFCVLLGIAMMGLASCTYVDPGFKALKVYALGEKKGKIEVVGIGRHPVHILGYYSYYRYPTNLQQWSWTASGESSKGENQQVVFQVEGQELSVDIGIAFNFAMDDTKLVYMFEYFRCEPDEIVARHFRKDVRSFFNEVAAKMKVEDAYSTQKEPMREKVFHLLKEKYAPLGVEIIELTYLSPIRLPQVVKEAVDNKVVAKQKAEMRENEVAEKEAEARKQVAEAKGIMQKDSLLAVGKAYAIDIEGKALSRNPNVIRLRELDVQRIAAESAKSWQNVFMTPGQANAFFGMPGK